MSTFFLPTTHTHTRERRACARRLEPHPLPHPTMMTCMQFAQPLDSSAVGCVCDITTSLPPLTSHPLRLWWHLSDLGYNVTAGWGGHVCLGLCVLLWSFVYLPER